MSSHFWDRARLTALAATTLVLCLVTAADAHGVDAGDAAFIQQASGTQIISYAYFGAKHMITGNDHLLFLVGVIFFLYRQRDVMSYVTLFAIGHSVTLLFGVLSGIHVNAFIIDAIIGPSVVYKGLDNLGAYRRWFGFPPNTKAAVLIFGLFHGFGLATKLQEFTLSRDGLVANILSFNVGVEVGQILTLTAILIAMGFWRRSAMFPRQAFAANALLMAGGFMLIGFQLTGYFTTT